MPQAGPIVSLQDVTLRYDGDVRALDGVTLSVARGERLCVLGANGSGKSTLASVIAGLLAPDEGEVRLLGQRVCAAGRPDLGAYQRARRGIGLVFQNPDDQIVTSVVEEDVAFGPENLMLSPAEIGVRVERELARVALTDYARSDPARLSGGQKQRVALAGALAMEPQVLVLDEPGALLDVRGRRAVMRVMGTLADSGTTVVHITHFMEEALAADRVIVMDHGRIVLEGTPEEVFCQGGRIARLGLEVPFTGRLSRALRERGLDVPWTCDEGVLMGACRELAGRVRRHGAGHAPQAGGHGLMPAISTRNVFYTYAGPDGRSALTDVSFDVRKGSSVAVIGQTGSGKSTLVRLLCALEAPDRGRVVLDGVDTARARDRRLLHGRIGYVMQHPERQLFAETVLKDVAYGPTNLGLPADEVMERCARALATVGLVGKEGASPFQLSGGQQRLCAIAGVLAMQPQTLVLDEPTAGLDPRGRAQLDRILERVRERGVTTVRVTHSMDDAARSEQVIVLSQARLLMQGTPAEVFAERHEEALRGAGLGLPSALRWALSLGLGEGTLTMEALVDALADGAPGDATRSGGREGDGA